MAEKEKIYEFSFNNQLPRVYDVVNAIISVEPGAVQHKVGKPESQGRKMAVHYCGVKLKRLWERSFGIQFIKTEKNIKQQIRKELDNYNKFMKSRKWQGKSKREKLKLWRKENSELFDCFTPSFKPSLFDEYEMFETEKKFYYDQLGSRVMFISEEIDEEYESARDSKLNELFDSQKKYDEELSFIFAENDDLDEPPTNPDRNVLEHLATPPSTSRSGLCIRRDVRSIGVQTDIYEVLQPPVRKVKVCSEGIKTALSEMSVAAKISPKQARLAAQAYSKNWYNHTYYLSYREKYPEQEIKKPRTAEDYALYSDIYPDTKTIANHKHGQSLYREYEAASALINKKPEDKVILHFDTTSRSRIEGEWPSLILKILSPPNHVNKFTLRPLFFAYEDRLNICRLIVETLHRLALTIKSTPVALWETIYGFMTDSVTKNLNVEQLVADTLESKHVPHHFLCTSHTSEKFDEALLSTISSIEKEISLREKLEASNPQLKSFYRGKRSIVQCALVALTKLITPDASAKSCSLSDEFDALVERKGMVKLISLYQERKFTKLGTTAACMINSLDLYSELLEQRHKNNLLVKACRLYLNCEFIMCAFRCLAFFTYKIGMPFLNMCEISTQREMKTLLPKLYKDLKNSNIDCLNDFLVQWNRIKADEPTSPLGQLIIDRMCKASAEGLRIQRGREYGFFGEEFTPRATIVAHLPDEELSLIPSNNLECERNLSVAGVYMEQSSKCSNRFFKSKCTRDNVTLHKAAKVKRISRSLKKALDQREEKWFDQQKKLKEEHIISLIQKGKDRDDYLDKVLAKCKSWGGPLVSLEEMRGKLEGKNDTEQRQLLRHEITYQRCTHPSDAGIRKELYLINKQTVSSMTYNLGILLSHGCLNEENNGEIFLPTEEDVFNIISLSTEQLPEDDTNNKLLSVNETCAVVWDIKGRPAWFLGYVIEMNHDFVKVEHLTRVNKLSNILWKYGNFDDIQNVNPEQILPITVVSDWDYTDPNNFVLRIENFEDITLCFENFVKDY